MRLGNAFTFAVLMCGLATSAFGQSWDMVADFRQGIDTGDPPAAADNAWITGATNPNGVWSYGYHGDPAQEPAYATVEDALGGGWTLYDNANFAECCLHNWRIPESPDNNGNVNLNFSNDIATNRPDWGQTGMSWEPNQLAHMTDVFPVNGLLTTTRFTAPADGLYSYSMAWENRATNGEPSIVYAAVNGGKVFEDLIDGFPGSSALSQRGDDDAIPAVDPSATDGWGAEHSAVIQLSAGDTIDVGVKATNDLTHAHEGGLHQVGTTFTVSVVPEPSSLILLALGLGFVLRRRR